MNKETGAGLAIKKSTLGGIDDNKANKKTTS